MECSSVDLFQIERQHYPEKFWSSYNSLYCSHHSLLIYALGELFVFWFSFFLKGNILVIKLGIIWPQLQMSDRCWIWKNTLGVHEVTLFTGLTAYFVRESLFLLHFYSSLLFFSPVFWGSGEETLCPYDRMTFRCLFTGGSLWLRSPGKPELPISCECPHAV